MPLFSMLRRLAIRLLRLFGDRDVTIRHHWIDRKIKLNLYRHRGYWWKGQSRERDELEAIRRIVKPGDTVFELGGHIGYITQLFSHLAGPQGHVLVFEPSPDNLQYLRPNVAGLENTEIVEKAVSDRVGEVTLYEERLSGQNNSIVPEYDVFEAVRAGSGVDVEVTRRQVMCTTVDQEAADRFIQPNIMKIDIEGAELMALQGALGALMHARPIIMVELSKHVRECIALLKKNRYVLVTSSGEDLKISNDADALCYAFAVPQERDDVLKTAFPKA